MDAGGAACRANRSLSGISEMLLQVSNGMSNKLSSITEVTSKFNFTRIQHCSLLKPETLLSLFLTPK